MFWRQRFKEETGTVILERIGFDKEPLTEAFFEFVAESEGRVELLQEFANGEIISQVELIGGRQIMYLWKTKEGTENVTLETEDRLNDGRWHTVNIERNLLEIRLVVDRKDAEMKNSKGRKIVASISDEASFTKV